MRKRYQYFLGMLCLLAILAGSIGLLWQIGFLSQRTVVQTVYPYTYTILPEIQVILRPNATYAEREYTAEIYPSALLQTIQVQFPIRFSAQQSADMTLEYEEIAYLQGITDSGQVLWEKNVTARKQKTENKTGSTYTALASQQIDWKTAVTAAQQAIAETGAAVSVQLQCTISGTFTADTVDGRVHKPFTAIAALPLFQEYCAPQIKTVQESGHLTKTTEKPIFIAGIICSGFLIGLGGSGCLILRFQMQEMNGEQRIERQIRRLLRKYHNKIIRLRTPNYTEEYYTQYEVAEMQDLLRIAQETAHPICCFLSGEHTKMLSQNYFYVQLENVRFLYRIR